jgi:hypothetical protein
MSHEERVWIAQCLCPSRHCIAALIGVFPHEAAATRGLAIPLRERITSMEEAGTMNPWCGICGARSASWRVEVGRTPYRSMAEAEGPLQQNEAEQALARAVLGTHRGKPPGRA